MADVFLSYKREDRARAGIIADAIEKHGFSVFYDAEIDVGESWTQRIDHEVKAASCVAVLWSSHSSDTVIGEWVHNEARVGKDRGVLAPALIGDCEIPLEFSSLQAADLRAWRGDPAAAQWRLFNERIAECVQRPPVKLRARPLALRWVRGLVAIALIAVLGAVGFVAWNRGRLGPTPTISNALALEWSSYVTSQNCPAMRSWVAQYEVTFRSWDLVKTASDQMARICGEDAAAPSVDQLPTAQPLPAGELLSELRTQNTARLTDDQIAAAARRLGVDPATIKAIMWFQTSGAPGFRADGRPAINFEPHIFSRLTGGAYDDEPGGFSSRTFQRGTYSLSQEERWTRLSEAYARDPSAAFSATAWGVFRIMGLNYETCGFTSIEEFVRAQAVSEESQLQTFEAFIRTRKLAAPLAERDWPTFTSGFFGSDQFASDLERFYDSFSAGRTP